MILDEESIFDILNDEFKINDIDNIIDKENLKLNNEILDYIGDNITYINNIEIVNYLLKLYDKLENNFDIELYDNNFIMDINNDIIVYQDQEISKLNNNKNHKIYYVKNNKFDESEKINKLIDLTIENLKLYKKYVKQKYTFSYYRKLIIGFTKIFYKSKRFIEIFKILFDLYIDDDKIILNDIDILFKFMYQYFSDDINDLIINKLKSFTINDYSFQDIIGYMLLIYNDDIDINDEMIYKILNIMNPCNIKEDLYEEFSEFLLLFSDNIKYKKIYDKLIYLSSN